MAMAFATGGAGLGIPLPDDHTGPGSLTTLEDALGTLLEGNEKIPLSAFAAALLNLLATQAAPASLVGPFLTPLPRLSYARKAKAFELLERTDSDLVALLDVHFPEPLTGSVSGLLKFVGGALLTLALFAALGEYAVYDPATKKLTARPVGWRLTGYEGRVDGLPDFKGYYQGREEAAGDA
ncbi:hypothetical protein ACFQVC_07660 [Streptomyces monticola]|uniref:Uncharacterized protein n=1 Tax=Streptomyces monticola TaxID=2666263 RepID=A0ABW2JF31_9ACTN